MNRIALALVVQVLFASLACAQEATFDVRRYGAAGDGRQKDTAAIQRAIDAAASHGGVVLLSGGSFLSGTLTLKSNITLRIDAGATLLGSAELGDYRKNRWLALIEARKQQHIAITGPGTIDGQGAALAADVERQAKAGKIADPLEHNRPNETNRPQLIELVDCSNVSVSNVTLKDSSCWVETYQNCDNLKLDHVTVRSTAFWNNDGIDLVDCRNASVTHCDVDSADDGICLKSGEGHACENIVISDCKVRSSASAFKFGTSSHGGFKHIRVRGLQIHDTFRAAIALESVDGAVIEDIDIADVQAKNTGAAIFIRLGHRNKKGPPGTVRDVRISDVSVEVPAGPPDAGYPLAGPAVKAPHNLFPSSIVGLPDHRIAGVTIKNVAITFAGGGRRDVADVPLDKLSSIPERADRYPEFSMFGELPAWGFYVRHAEGIKFENVTLRTAKPDYRSAFVFDDADRISLDDVHINSAGENPVIVKRQTKDLLIKSTPAPEGTKEFVREVK